MASFSFVLFLVISYYRIPYDIDSDDRYKPCFWNYLDEWMPAFIRLLAENNKLEIIDSYFVRSISDLLSILSHIAVSLRMELLLTQDT